MKKRIILASGSPRRKEILKEMGLEFEVIPSKFDEFIEDDNFEYKIIEEIALNKALDVSKKENNAIIISADTVVIHNNKILGKPKCEKDAFNTLKRLSGEEHKVVTSICIINTPEQTQKIESVTSSVTFNELSDEMILSYIMEYQPLDKAGSYGIQELSETFIKEIKGSKKNIIGLCSDRLEQMLQDV